MTYIVHPTSTYFSLLRVPFFFIKNYSHQSCRVITLLNTNVYSRIGSIYPVSISIIPFSLLSPVLSRVAMKPPSPTIQFDRPTPPFVDAETRLNELKGYLSQEEGEWQHQEKNILKLIELYETGKLTRLVNRRHRNLASGW